MPLGNLLATGVLFVLAAFQSDADFEAWGWRIPFLLSAVLVLIGLYVRLQLEESPVYQEAKAEIAEKKTGASHMPILEVIKTYPKEVFIAMGMRMAENISYYIFTIVSITYVTTYLDQDKDLILKMLLIAAALQFFLSRPWVRSPTRSVAGRCTSPVPSAWASGRFFFFGLLDTNRAGPVLLAVVVGLFFHTLMYAPQAAFFSELFGTSVRYTGASVGYQLASIFAGALAPIIAVDLLGSADEKNTFAVALYVAAASVITIVAVLLRQGDQGDLAAPRPRGPRRARLTGPLLVSRSPRPAFSAVSAMRASRVACRLAVTIHTRMLRFTERGNSSHASRAPGCSSKAAARSSGTTRFSTSSSRVQVPFSLAVSIDACPAGPIRPSASRRSMRSCSGVTTRSSYVAG